MLHKVPDEDGLGTLHAKKKEMKLRNNTVGGYIDWRQREPRMLIFCYPEQLQTDRNNNDQQRSVPADVDQTRVGIDGWFR